jgi:hypothetical protein
MVVQIARVPLVVLARRHDVPGHENVFVLEESDDGGNGGVILERTGHPFNEHVRNPAQGGDHDDVPAAPFGDQDLESPGCFSSLQGTAPDLDDFHAVVSSFSMQERSLCHYGRTGSGVQGLGEIR